MGEVTFDRDAFERQWQQQMDDERRLAHDFVTGRFADDLQPPDMRGEYLTSLMDEGDVSIIHDELERLSVAVIAWEASRDLGDALRHVRGGSHLATRNVGFEFESDFFRLASYDWSEDEDADGNPIVRHNFACKPSGTHLDWYKWAGRDDWASPGLVAAIEAVDGQNVPLYAWWERVMDECIESLIVTDDAKFNRIVSCGWRHYDEGAIPHGLILVDAEVPSPEVDSIEFRHPTEGYVGFKVDRERGDALPADVTDMTDEYPELVAELAVAIGQSKEHPLSQTIPLTQEDCPEGIGYVSIGGHVFRRLVLDSPTWQANPLDLPDGTDDADEPDDSDVHLPLGKPRGLSGGCFGARKYRQGHEGGLMS